MKRLIQALVASATLPLAGCGVDFDSSFSCDERSTSAQLCTDYETDTEVSSTKNECTQKGGTVRSAPCSRIGVIGGCRISVGSTTITAWYYSGLASTVRQACSGVSGVFLSQ